MAPEAPVSRRVVCIKCNQLVEHTASIVEGGRIFAVCHLCHLSWVLAQKLRERRPTDDQRATAEASLAELCMFVQSWELGSAPNAS